MMQKYKSIRLERAKSAFFLFYNSSENKNMRLDTRFYIFGDFCNVFTQKQHFYKQFIL